MFGGRTDPDRPLCYISKCFLRLFWECPEVDAMRRPIPLGEYFRKMMQQRDRPICGVPSVIGGLSGRGPAKEDILISLNGKLQTARCIEFQVLLEGSGGEGGSCYIYSFDVVEREKRC